MKGRDFYSPTLKLTFNFKIDPEVLHGIIGLVLMLAATFCFSAPAVAGTMEENEVTAKLGEFEERLKRLEEQQRSQEKEASNSQARSTATLEVQELRRQLDILAAEVEKLRSGEQQIEVSEEKAKSLGVGPSAASVYRKTQGVSIAGYGEMLYENFADKNERKDVTGKSSQLDFVRMILYAGYRFNDKFLFNSEVEFEHASTSKEGSASVEFAYLDYLATDYLALRAGLLLVPMGLTNEFHEPNVFLGAHRPETETRIIPSTWRENGFGVVGSAGIFNYRAYLINGLNAGGFSSNGLRGGRQKGSKTKASDLAFVGRLDVAPTPGVFFGGSLYRGGSGQDQFNVNGKNLDVNTTIGELHVQLQLRGFDLRTLYARAAVDDVAELNQALGLGGKKSVGEAMQGGYVQIGYNLLSQFHETIGLSPYYRFEKVNTQDELPQGFFADPARDRTFHTLGFEFRPIFNIVLKTDYLWIRNEAKSGLNQFNMALGYTF
ncbi:MAG: hypothetical protein ACE5MK_09480 [Acidobacteriota bacterium]